MEKNSYKGLSVTGFILSAIGTAVGLGNIWGFPTKMINFGGPAFLIPYVIAVFVLGLPILILEMNLGSKWRSSPVLVYQQYLGKGGKYFGWFQTTIQLLIGTYYSVIMTWVLVSAGTTFLNDFGKENFFDNEILGKSGGEIDSFAALGKIQPILLFAVVAIFIMAAVIIILGVKKGIERANKLMIPLLFVLIIGFAIYGLTLKGASQGLDLVFKPDFNKILNPKAWAGAFGQAFFSLSLVVAVMIVYSSSKPRNSDNGNEALIVMSGDTLIALLASIIIATTLGYSDQAGIVKINEGNVYWAKDWAQDSVNANQIGGSTFIFQVFPQMFQNINLEVASYLGSFLGLFFFIALFFAAMSSLIGLIEPAVAALIENQKMNRKGATVLVIACQFLFGLIFLFENGGNLMNETTDAYFVTYLILISAIVEIGIFAFSWKKLKRVLAFHNKHTWLKLKKWFYFLLIFCLVLLLAVTCYGLYDNITSADGFAKVNSFKWLVTTLFFFVPFIAIVAVLGYKTKEKKLEEKLENNE